MQDPQPQLRVTGPLRGYFFATIVSSALDSPGQFLVQAKVCKEKPASFVLAKAIIEISCPRPWPSQNEAHLQGFRRVKELLEGIRSFK